MSLKNKIKTVWMKWLAAVNMKSQALANLLPDTPQPSSTPPIHPGAGYHTIRIRSPFTSRPEHSQREVRITGVVGFHAMVSAVDSGPALETLISESHVLPQSLPTYRNVVAYFRSQRVSSNHPASPGQNIAG